MPTIEFGEWLPDLPAHQNQGALVADNVIPGVKSYKSVLDHIPFTGPLAGKPIGGIRARSNLGTIYNIVGTSAGLFRIDSTIITDLSQAGGYNVTQWDFEQFGNRIIAVGGIGTPVQYFDMDSAPTVNFEDLPGNPPQATYVGVIRDFLMLGDVEINGTRERDTIHWSGFNNTELWEPSIATQSDFQPLRGRGADIQRIISGRVGTVFLEQSIFRLSYAGPPNIFRADEIHIQRGTASPWSIARVGDLIFFHSEEGFLEINALSGQVKRIGANRVDNTFAATAAIDRLFEMRAVIDRRERFVLWLYKASSSAVNFDRYIAYNWTTDRWAGGVITISFIMEFASGTVSLDDLDAVLGHGVDGSPTFTVDSDAFSGGAIGMLVFDDLFQPGTLTGQSLPTQIDTAEFSEEDRMLWVNGVRPLIEGLAPNSTVTPITRNRLVDNPVVGSPVTINALGQADLRVHARYHRYRIDATEAYKHASGVQLQPKVLGRR